jgi:predicted AAA+ superfamily ATPase
MMISRKLGPKLTSLFSKFPVVTLVGPRQSGKTTLAKELFAPLPYVNMEDFTMRSFALEDPKSFLKSYPDGLIIDEVQHVPELFSYLQVFVDEKDRPGQYVLTGSQQFLVNAKISQSLAGRVALTTLLPLAYPEIKDQEKDLYSLLFKGFYPRLYRYDIEPTDFYPHYIQTYVERDVRQIINITDLSLFQKFLKLCAGRVGQLLNVSSLANDCGISHATAKSWLSLLEMSFILTLVKPYHKNFNKRLVKSPKIYFYDTGLLCSLLDISSSKQLETHYARGALFENFIFLELTKAALNQGKRPHVYFWRDKQGDEVDFLVEVGEKILPIEVKSGQTLNESFFTALDQWKNWAGQNEAYLVYGGEESQIRKRATVLSWRDLGALLEKTTL